MKIRLYSNSLKSLGLGNETLSPQTFSDVTVAQFIEYLRQCNAYETNKVLQKAAAENLFQDLLKIEMDEKTEAEELQALIAVLLSLKKETDISFWREIHEKYLLEFTEKILNTGKNAHFELLDLIEKRLKAIEREIKNLSEPDKKETSPLWEKFKYFTSFAALAVILIPGILKGAADGFNGINSLIEAVPGLAHTWLAFSLWGVFIAIGIIIYISFDYRSIASAFSVDFLSTNRALKDCKTQCHQLEINYLHIAKLIHTFSQSPSKISHKHTITEIFVYKKILDQHVEKLKSRKENLDKNKPDELTLYLGKSFAGFFGGTLFLSTGFFSGHAIAIYFGLGPIDPWTLAIAGIVASASFISFIALECTSFFNLIDLVAGTSEKISGKVTHTLEKIETYKLSVNSDMELITSALAHEESDIKLSSETLLVIENNPELKKVFENLFPQKKFLIPENKSEVPVYEMNISYDNAQ